MTWRLALHHEIISKNLNNRGMHNMTLGTTLSLAGKSIHIHVQAAKLYRLQLLMHL